MPHDFHIQPIDSLLIGRPVSFVAGQFAGLTLRAELIELQQAELGRKYARKDRRPFDPPPVVQLKLYRVLNIGTANEKEEEILDYSRMQSLGFLCHVDLFPVALTDIDSQRLDVPPYVGPPTTLHPSAHHGTRTSSQSPLRNDSRNAEMIAMRPSNSPTSHSAYSVPSPAPFLTRTLPFDPVRAAHSSHSSEPVSSASGSDMQLSRTYGPEEEVVAYINNQPILESSNETELLVGATFVSPTCLDYNGRKVLMFIFSDLAVRAEGLFMLRYRAFDILSNAFGHVAVPVLAQCFGGVFKIYSSKEFPGLPASTDLTKYISRFGVRLNSREQERKRRKKTSEGSP
ncbi:uncharacterized protein FIBRA_04968 [Fibroporia radiculosa]|uniref:Velvet domain-containing protein n=1 Tax=Fibroporia radiculosa TaxID=599839 RepID=J4IAG2_9APHY|nr:uncharacterized protein FIBRA_04968 [Fibroporia radiculosa]CCM02856.1 predicted protein [Fibroporia radiculosa]